MGVFKTSKLLYGNPSLIAQIATTQMQAFKDDGYDVKIEDTGSMGKDISITKGGLFKALLGLKTALKIRLVPRDNKIQFDAGVGIFGLQAIPAAVAFFVTWPVVLTQIWGMIQQSKLDNKALEIAEQVIYDDARDAYQTEQYIFCPHDGKRIPANSEFCPFCGKKVR